MMAQKGKHRELHAAVRKVARSWRDYGAPSMSQCAKIAYDAIAEYVQRKGEKVETIKGNHLGLLTSKYGLWANKPKDGETGGA